MDLEKQRPELKEAINSLFGMIEMNASKEDLLSFWSLAGDVLTDDELGVIQNLIKLKVKFNLLPE